MNDPIFTRSSIKEKTFEGNLRLFSDKLRIALVYHEKKSNQFRGKSCKILKEKRYRVSLSTLWRKLKINLQFNLNLGLGLSFDNQESPPDTESTLVINHRDSDLEM